MKILTCLLFISCASPSGILGDGLSVSLSPSSTSSAPVGSLVTWTASTTGFTAGNISFRFRVRDRETNLPVCRNLRTPRASTACAERGFSMLRDYGPVNTIAWTASDNESEYEIEVTARDNNSGQSAVAISDF